MSFSIVIPTTATRTSIFKTIDSVFKSISNSNVKVEVVVNRLKSDQHIIDRLKLDPRIELRFQSQVHQTAEASAVWAAYSSTSEWIWLLGDDDLATPGSVTHILDLLKLSEVDFWLLNVLLVFNKIPLEYYRIGPKPIQICHANKLWERCGFFSILTTISCLLIKRSRIDIELFTEFHEIQGIYSHSFSLLAMLKNSNVGATDFFCVLRNEEAAENIAESLSSYTQQKDFELGYIWTTGAKNLFELLSNKTKIPISDLLKYREIELRKNPNNPYQKSSDLEILVSSCQSVIDRFSFNKNGNFIDSEIYISQNLIFKAPVRISL
jgi:hypothetical protein